MFVVVVAAAVLLIAKSRYVVLLVNSPSCMCRVFYGGNCKLFKNVNRKL